MPLDEPKAGDDSRLNWKYFGPQNREIQRLATGLTNLIPRKKYPLSGTGGWNFADPIEYDREASYELNKVVVVSPDNDAVTEGVSLAANETHGIHTGVDGNPNPDDAEVLDIAVPGMWVALRDPKVLSEVQPEDPEAPRNYDIHVPVWPLHNADVDSEDNFWMLIRFEPIEAVFCNTNTGDDGDYYLQAVRKPEPEAEP